MSRDSASLPHPALSRLCRRLQAAVKGHPVVPQLLDLLRQDADAIVDELEASHGSCSRHTKVSFWPPHRKHGKGMTPLTNDTPSAFLKRRLNPRRVVAPVHLLQLEHPRPQSLGVFLAVARADQDEGAAAIPLLDARAAAACAAAVVEAVARGWATVGRGGALCSERCRLLFGLGARARRDGVRVLAVGRRRRG